MSDPAPVQNSPVPPFDPSKPHLQRPRLRPVRGFPAKIGETMALGLADARQISEKVVFAQPAAQLILPHLNGERTIDEIVAAVGRGLQRQMLEVLVAQLDDAGLLFGPKFDEILKKVRHDFDSSAILPPASTAAFADLLVQSELGESATDQQKADLGPAKMRSIFDQWIAQALEKAEKPSLDALPKAIIAPHIDYPRGWLNYASIWGRLRVVDRPDRVIILGTNHFGEATGVCACDKGYQTPLGTCHVDQAVVDGLRQRLGERLFANRYDHEREHSIELQIPWIQHILGTDDQGKFCRVFGALVHDPTVNAGESYDGQGVGLDEFVTALRDVLASLPGKTLVVSSADMSHVGPAFGDQQQLAGDGPEATEFRNRAFSHDQEMINLLVGLKFDEFVTAMAWQQNPTRWCSIGNVVATAKLTQPESIEVFNYAAAMDGEGMGMVSSISAAMN